MLSAFVVRHPSTDGETKSRAKRIQEASERELRPGQVKAARAAAQSAAMELLVENLLEENRISDF
jgi:hypothetical protein